MREKRKLKMVKLNDMRKTLIRQILDFILDKFKVRHSGWWIFVVVVLVAVKSGIDYLLNSSGIAISAHTSEILNWVLFAIAALTGSHTPKNE